MVRRQPLLDRRLPDGRGCISHHGRNLFNVKLVVVGVIAPVRDKYGADNLLLSRTMHTRVEYGYEVVLLFLASGNLIVSLELAQRKQRSHYSSLDTA